MRVCSVLLWFSFICARVTKELQKASSSFEKPENTEFLKNLFRYKITGSEIYLRNTTETIANTSANEQDIQKQLVFETHK